MSRQHSASCRVNMSAPRWCFGAADDRRRRVSLMSFMQQPKQSEASQDSKHMLAFQTLWETRFPPVNSRAITFPKKTSQSPSSWLCQIKAKSSPDLRLSQVGGSWLVCASAHPQRFDVFGSQLAEDAWCDLSSSLFNIDVVICITSDSSKAVDSSSEN